MEILEGYMMADHVHLLLSIPPKYSISQIMGYLKGKSAMMILERHSNLKYKFGNRHFGAEGYYVSTAKLNTLLLYKNILESKKKKIRLWTNLKLKNIQPLLRVESNQSS